MKWNFFYDEDKEERYDTVDDWYKDTKLLVWLSIAIIALLILIFICVKYFYF